MARSVPTDKARVKAAAKRKFKVYANYWLAQEYKRRGGKYKQTK